MRKDFVRGELGMVSIFGLCALAVLMILSATMYAASRTHILTAQRFLARDALRNAAEDGVRLALSRMNTDAGTAAKANGATGQKESLLTTSIGDASVEVFARKKADEILLLGLGMKDEERARAIGVVKQSGGKYVIDHWER